MHARRTRKYLTAEQKTLIAARFFLGSKADKVLPAVPENVRDRYYGVSGPVVDRDAPLRAAAAELVAKVDAAFDVDSHASEEEPLPPSTSCPDPDCEGCRLVDMVHAAASPENLRCDEESLATTELDDSSVATTEVDEEELHFWSQLLPDPPIPASFQPNNNK